LRLCPKTEEYLDWKTEEIVKTLNDGLKSSEPKIYTMDSWFDSSAIKEYLESKGQYKILGAHTGRDADLWSIAKDGLLPNTWRQYYNQQAKWHLFFQIMVFIAVCPTLIFQSTYWTSVLRNAIFQPIQESFLAFLFCL
jgi:hypothetical protein